MGRPVPRPVAMVPRVSLAFITLLLLAAQPALAGSQATPEIKDKQYDQALAGGQSACAGSAPTGCIYIPVDIWNAWVTEKADDLQFHIELAQAPPSNFGTVTYTFHFTAGNTTAYDAIGVVGETAPAGSGATTPGGVATAAALDGTVLTLTVPKAAVSATPGTILGSLMASSSATAGASPQEGATDKAPDTGFGANYTVAGGSTPPSSNTTTSSSKPPVTTNRTSTPPPVGNTTTSPTTSTKASPLGAPSVFGSIGAALFVARYRRRA